MAYMKLTRLYGWTLLRHQGDFDVFKNQHPSQALKAPDYPCYVQGESSYGQYYYNYLTFLALHDLYKLLKEQLNPAEEV